MDKDTIIEWNLSKETLDDFARCSREPEKVKRYIRCADRLVKDGLLYDDFIEILKKWKFTDKDVKTIKSVMAEFPNHSLNIEQMEWLEEYRSSITNDDKRKCLADFLSINGVSDTDDIINQIDNIKAPKEIRRLFINSPLAKTEITLKVFCDMVIKYLGKEGKRGWNYENARR